MGREYIWTMNLMTQTLVIPILGGYYPAWDCKHKNEQGRKLTTMLPGTFGQDLGVLMSGKIHLQAPWATHGDQRVTGWLKFIDVECILPDVAISHPAILLPARTFYNKQQRPRCLVICSLSNGPGDTCPASAPLTAPSQSQGPLAHGQHLPRKDRHFKFNHLTFLFE